MQKLKISFYLVLIISLLLILSNCSGNEKNNTDEIPLTWGNYTHPSLIFSIRYPENWVTKDSEELPFLVDYMVDFAPSQTDLETGNIPLMIELSSFSYDQNVDIVTNSVTDSTINEYTWFENLKYTEISGINPEGQKVLYRIAQRNKRQSFKFIVSDTSDEFLETFDKMFWSFKVLKTNN